MDLLMKECLIPVFIIFGSKWSDHYRGTGNKSQRANFQGAVKRHTDARQRRVPDIKISRVIEKQNIKSQNIEPKVSKAKYLKRRISKSQNIELQNIEFAKYRKYKISYRIMSNVKISITQNIDGQNIECKISSGKISDTKDRSGKTSNANYRRGKISKAKYRNSKYP